ncbi:MlaE family ABC transporter permease [Methylotuvimicrobium buryatense]|uniref:ABC transporter permease n=1 Tax=Methylotuvimicrobium buryatense TaxID=95641 RepID=A0A4P9UIX9_METBY|nr:ABC transporter permease [Methylotuvimicrobium buryatense]QCW80927.1 ABC transporter permease [Methylotuvimicrobium buryatense]
MASLNNKLIAKPVLQIEQENNLSSINLKGSWNLLAINESPSITRDLKGLQYNSDCIWRLDEVEALDTAGAWLIWQAWGEEFPNQVEMRPEHKRLFDRWKTFSYARPEEAQKSLVQIFKDSNKVILAFYRHVFNGIILLGQLLLDTVYLFRSPSKIPWPEISMTIYSSGVKALGITALVGFLIGIVLSYLSALQLQAFGAEIYIINILGMSIIRELGPLLAAILVAGRSGSALTAQIGIMRVAEELDALSSMGISHSLRIIFPIVVALTVTLPLLTVWTNAAALLGGMVSAWHTLDISMQQFVQRLPDSVPLVNVFIGVGKAAVFGMLIGMIACHYGFHIKPNSESLGNETTNSVVASITVVIMVDAIFAILFMGTGMP